MRELPKPENEWDASFEMYFQSSKYPASQVLAIQRQAYEDGLRDAILDFMERATLVTNPTVRLAMKAHAEAMIRLTASQKEPQ